jgi:hypothetical protein
MPFSLMTCITGGMNKHGFGLYYSKIGQSIIAFDPEKRIGLPGKASLR